jgi:hypothetical protein
LTQSRALPRPAGEAVAVRRLSLDGSFYPVPSPSLTAAPMDRCGRSAAPATRGAATSRSFVCTKAGAIESPRRGLRHAAASGAGRPQRGVDCPLRAPPVQATANVVIKRCDVTSPPSFLNSNAGHPATARRKKRQWGRGEPNAAAPFEDFQLDGLSPSGSLDRVPSTQ